MKIVSVSQTQTFKYIPRAEYVTQTLKYTVTDEQTNKSETVYGATTVASNKNFLISSMTFGSDNAPFREGHFYTLEVLNGSTLVYRDKLFCTSQTPVTQSRYNVNKDVYDTNDTHNNDYIVL
jgi:hypothetical protein